jgi:hypothetical protein
MMTYSLVANGQPNHVLVDHIRLGKPRKDLPSKVWGSIRQYREPIEGQGEDGGRKADTNPRTKIVEETVLAFVEVSHRFEAAR